MAGAFITVRFSLFVLLSFLVAAAAVVSAAAQNPDISPQLDILQKITDYNASLAESTLRNVTFLIAFLGGILSFLAPCTVALLPAFFAYTAKGREGITLATLEFFIGFSLTFVALGLALTSLGRVSFVMFQQDIAVLVQLAGLILVFLGVMIFFGRGFSFLRLRARLPKDAIGTFVFGSLFAVGWSACIGPIIAGIFTMAAVFHNYAYTALLLFFYALGLAVPLFIASFAYDRFSLSESRLMKGFTIALKVGKKELLLTSMNIVSGLLLTLLGLFFILNKGTTAITAADLLGKIAVFVAVAAAAYLFHRLVVLRLVKSGNLARVVAVAEVFSAIAAFSFITHMQDVRTTGLAEILSRAVLENTRLFSVLAGAVLVMFAVALAYFVRRQLKRVKSNESKRN